MQIDWKGPFGWPTKEAPLPDWPGIYLWAFDYRDSYIAYAAGITRRPLVKRFSEHRREMLKGTFTLFDLHAMSQGVCSVIWQGFWMKKHPAEKYAEYESRKAELRALAQEQMDAVRIFAAECTTEPRVLERLEATTMQQLYDAPTPYCDIAARGMKLAPRWPSETPIRVNATFDVHVTGLHATFEI